MVHRCVILVLVCLTLTSQKLIADYGKNEIGIRIGYFKPKGYEAYFPVQSEATEEYLHYDNAIININYNRKINSGFDVGVDLGFTGVLDNSDHNTILNSFPLGIYAVTKIISLYGLECYGGGGLNFWYMETKKGDTQGLSGYHLRLNLKFQVFRVELDYSTINDFGAEDKDIGGWSIKIGAAFTFSYH